MGRLKYHWTFVLWFLSVPFFVLATYYEAPLAKRHAALEATDLPCGSEIVVKGDEKYLFDSRSAILYESSQNSKEEEGKETPPGSRRRRDTSMPSPIKMKIISDSPSEEEQPSKRNPQNRMKMPTKNQSGMSANKPRPNNQMANRNQLMTQDKSANQNQFPLKNQQMPQNQNEPVSHGQMPVRKLQQSQNYTLPNKQMPLVNNSQSYNQSDQNYSQQQPQGRGGDHGHKSNYGHGGSGSYGRYGNHHSGGGSSSYKGAASHYNEYTEPITCQWKYEASPDCSLEVNVVRFKPGDMNCDKQQLVIDDGHTEFKMCGYETLHPSFRAETSKLTIKYWRQPYTYRHVFKGYVTCEGRANRPKFDDKEYSSGGKNTENVEADNQAQALVEEAQPQQASVVEQEVVAEQTNEVQTAGEATSQLTPAVAGELKETNAEVGEVMESASVDNNGNIVEAIADAVQKALEIAAKGIVDEADVELEEQTKVLESCSKIEETSQLYEVEDVESTKMQLKETDFMIENAAQSQTLEQKRTMIENAGKTLEYPQAQIELAEAKEQQQGAQQNEEIVQVDESQVDETEQAQTYGNQVETEEQETEEGGVAAAGEVVDGTEECASQIEITGVVQEFGNLDAPDAVVAAGETAINQESETEQNEDELHQKPESHYYAITYTPTYNYNPYNPNLQTRGSATYPNQANTNNFVAGRSHEEEAEERTPYYGGHTQHAPNYQQVPYAGAPGPSAYPLKAIPGTVSITYPYPGSSHPQPRQGGGGAGGGGYSYLVQSLTNPNIKYLITCQLPQPYPCTPIHVSGAYTQQGPHTKRAVPLMPVVYG